MSECNLTVINDKRLFRMGIASALVILGVVFKNTSEQAKNLPQGTRTILGLVGMALFLGGWGFVAYNLYETIPDKAYIFIPAIFSIIVSVLVMKMTTLPKIPFGALFMAGWGILGWVISDHLEGKNKWLGPVAALLVISSMMFILPWQRDNCIVDGLGMPMFTMAWGIISVIYSYPTIEGIKTSGPECLKEIADTIPELKGYVGEIDCVIQSGCFDKVASMKEEESPQYISAVVDAIACAGEKCTTFKTISLDIECFIKNCLPAVIKKNPKTPGAWAWAIFEAYSACGVKTCHLPKVAL
jgi:hypothetical protein